MAGDVGPRPRAQRHADIGWECESRSQRRGQRRRVGGRDEPARGAGLRRARRGQDRLRGGADGGGDDGAAERLRFRGGAPERLGLGGGDDRDVRRSEGSGHVVDVADEPHATIEAMGGCLATEHVAGAAPLGIAGQDDDGPAELAAIAQQRRRLDQHALAFPGRQPRCLQDDRLAGCHAPGLPQGLDPDRRHRFRPIAREVDAAVDDADAFVRRTVTLANETGRVFRIGDHHVSARHDAVVEPFQASQSSAPDEAYYNTAQGARRDHIGYVKGIFRLADGAKLEVQPYLHTNKGAGDWTAPSYGASWSPDPIFFRQTQYGSQRYGTNLKATFELPGNELEIGGWYEHNESTIRRVGWRLKNAAVGPDVDFTNVLRLFFDRTGTYDTALGFIQNTNRLLQGRLKLNYGFKAVHIGADFVNNGRTIAGAKSLPDSARPNFSFPTSASFLPQFGAVYSASEHDEFFANVSENVNALPYSPQSGVYNTSAAAYQFFRDNTKPERATTVEAGYRTRRGPVEASLTLFNVAYRNRLIGVAVCPLTATCVSSFANVGGVTSRGAEGLVALRLGSGWSVTSTAAFTDATINDNYVSGTADTVRSKGKKVVDAPRLLGNVQLRYSKAGFVAQVGGRYVAERYFSILNSDDGKVPSYTTLDANAEYTLRGVPGAKELTFRANALNLTDTNYIGTMGTGGFTRSGDTQTLLAGARRLVFLSIGTRF